MYLELPVVKHVQIARKENHRKLVLLNVQIALSVDTHLIKVVPLANHVGQAVMELGANYVVS